MLDINYIREHRADVEKAARDKNVEVDIGALLALDESVRELRRSIDDLNRQKNELAARGSAGKPSSQDIESGKKLKTAVAEKEKELGEASAQLKEIAWRVPNVPFPDVPVGPDASGNVVLRSWGTPRKFDFPPKDHMMLGEALNIIDTERAAKVSGARFAYLKGGAALLQFALIQYTMALLTAREPIATLAAKAGCSSDKPFIPVVPPVMIRPEAFERMARLSSADKDERYYLQQDDLYLVGSAEHTLGSMHMDEILPEEQLPLRYIGYSTSFRREAGSYGKDTRGILRVHQFDKLEMESFSRGEDSLAEQELFVAVQEHILQQLGLPHRVMLICTGDMGKPDARQIDMETWMPAQNTFRETHTADLMTDYQTRRLATKIRRADGSLELAHTNDATAVAVGRMIIAIIENYQNADGTITVPEVLRPYMGGVEVIR